MADKALKEAVWLAKHPEEEAKYKGEYIAVANGKIVAHGKDVKKVIRKAREYSDDPLISKVEKEGLMVV